MRSPNRRHDLPLLHKYTSAATAQAILRTSSLRWSSPLLFNDPFDVPREMNLPFGADELRKAVGARFRDYYDGRAEPVSETVFSTLSAIARADPSERDLLVDLLDDTLHLLTVPTEITMRQFRTAWVEKVSRLRIVCFSAISDSPTMWAHYADNHRGVVLQFESSDERDSSFLLATPVVYQSESPTLPLVDRWARSFLGEEQIDWDDFFREYYYAKAEEWSYEQEYRAISASPDDSELYTDSAFFREDLRGIVLGTSVGRGEEVAIRALAKAYPNAVIYRAKIDHSTRRIIRVPDQTSL